MVARSSPAYHFRSYISITLCHLCSCFLRPHVVIRLHPLLECNDIQMVADVICRILRHIQPHKQHQSEL